MLTQKIKKGVITKKDFWFSEKPERSLLSSYMQSPVKQDIKGMDCKSFFTLHIDLSQSLDDIKASFDKGTSYEIRRAEKDGIKCSSDYSLDYFIEFFNEFAKAKGIQETSSNYNQFDQPVRITAACFEDEVFVMHSYMTDGTRARLLMSSSLYLSEADSKKRALIGRANRLLHFFDIETFKAEGYRIYDFGGYAKSTEDKFLQGINKFKMGFGGELIEEYNYTPSWR